MSRREAACVCAAFLFIGCSVSPGAQASQPPLGTAATSLPTAAASTRAGSTPTTVATSPPAPSATPSATASPEPSSLPVDPSIKPVSLSHPAAAAADALRACQVLAVWGPEKVGGMGEIPHVHQIGRYAPFFGRVPEFEVGRSGLGRDLQGRVAPTKDERGGDRPHVCVDQRRRQSLWDWSRASCIRRDALPADRRRFPDLDSTSPRTVRTRAPDPWFAAARMRAESTSFAAPVLLGSRAGARPGFAVW